MVSSIRELMERIDWLHANFDSPVLIDQYLRDAIEVDVDVVADGESVFVAGIMEHIEEAGIHSGDSACSLPPMTLAGGRVSASSGPLPRMWPIRPARVSTQSTTRCRSSGSGGMDRYTARTTNVVHTPRRAD